MPVANEEATMADVINEILNLNYDNLYLYAITDNYSKDRTEDIICEFAEKTDKVKCIHFNESTGLISCYLEGFRIALADGGEQIIEMDGGGSHKPCEIPLFIEKLEQGYDCVFGSRFVEGGSLENQPLYRLMLSKGGTLLANRVLGTNYKDMTSGFEAFNKEILQKMHFNCFLSTGHMYQTEMRYYCRNFNIIEVPINYEASESSLKFKSVLEAILILFKLRKNEKEIFVK